MSALRALHPLGSAPLRAADDPAFERKLDSLPQHLDEVLSPDEQSHWAADPLYNDLSGVRRDDLKLRLKHRQQYFRLLSHSSIGTAIALASRYVYMALPAIKRGEGLFWTVSCSQQPASAGTFGLLCVYVHNEAVLTIDLNQQSGQFVFTVQADWQPIQETYGADKQRFEVANPGAKVTRFRTADGSQRVTLKAMGARSAAAMFELLSVRQAIRSLNTRLMKSGLCTMRHQHCYDLADHLLVGESYR